MIVSYILKFAFWANLLDFGQHGRDAEEVCKHKSSRNTNSLLMQVKLSQGISAKLLERYMAKAPKALLVEDCICQRLRPITNDVVVPHVQRR